MKGIAKLFYSFIFCFLFLKSFSQSYPNDRSVLDSTIAPFYHGVASGDILSDKVIIWTRVTSSLPQVNVKWRIALDTGMTDIVREGVFTTSASRDYTVKVDVTGLEPNTYYYYEFEALNAYSQRGRTKTLPVGNVENLRVAFVSCANYTFGYFNAYDRITERNDIDMVLHLGDYIYEDGYKNSGVDTLRRRTFPEYDSYDLTSYRLRYSWYRLDPSLRNLHQQYPVEIIWDDHEFANDASEDSAANHIVAEHGNYMIRKAAAIKAYLEWTPTRELDERVNIINRKQSIGNLADLIYLENRIKRTTITRDTAILMTIAADPIVYDRPFRTMIGKPQREWLIQSLRTSTAKWRLIANQVIMAPYVFKGYFGLKFHQMAGWESFPLERKLLFDSIQHYGINNMVFLTGDIHVAMAFDVTVSGVPYNPNNGAGSKAVEFVADALVAGDVLPNDVVWMYFNNRNLKYIQMQSQGYCILDLNANRACCDWFQIDSVNTINTSHTYLRTLCSNDNQSYLVNASGPTLTTRIFPPLAPLDTRYHEVPTLISEVKNQRFIGIHPNPAIEKLIIQFFTAEIIQQPEFTIYSMDGKVFRQWSGNVLDKGLSNIQIDVNDLPTGQYIITLHSASGITSGRFIKF